MTHARVRTLLSALACGITAVLIATPVAVAGPGDFYSSFEAGDPAPTWTNTIDTDASGNERAAGVTGPKRTGLPGDVSDKVIAVEASGENSGGGEVAENLVDGSSQTKWLVFEETGWVEMELSEPVAVVHYALISANDAAGRDPQDWTLSGSNDGETWTELDAQTGQDFAERFQTKEYRFENATAYTHYRLDITANHGDDILQLAEIQLSNGDTSPPPPSDMTSKVGDGPRGGYTAKSGAGFTGLAALQYAGTHEAEGRGYSYNKVFDVDVPVGSTTELSYLIYPDFVDGDLGYPSTYASLDLVFTDGTYLSDLGATDQHGATLSPRGQQASKTLYTNQWNFKRSRIGAVAAGKTIDRILVAYDNPDGPTEFGGWIDDVEIEADPPQKQRSRPSDWVVTNRGTNSTGSFSRGNNIPATAVPHGFNFWIPVTNAGSLSWLYDYHRDNNDDNLPTLEAFAASHEPSPWMGERQTFQVMPSGAAGTPDTGRDGRALPFRHSNEVTSPHHYAVEFENGIETEIAPTDHAAMFRFKFPDGDANLVFDNVNDDASLTIDQVNGVVKGYSDVRSGLSDGAARMYVYARFDKRITESATSGVRTGYAKFDAGADKAVTMWIATSLISVDQARKNLDLEIAPDDSFDAVRDRAQAQWDDKLDVIEVEGGTEDQLTTLYSNLYRLFLYPNSAHENTGTREAPVWRHAVQSSSADEIVTAPEVADGKVYVNNGFWDTYRTTWSAYSLFASDTAGELVDGFVQQYRDGGWVSRWSSPGYANLMTGTSSDVAFADAYVKGIGGFDAGDAYDAAVKNATVAPPGEPNNSSVGRKGLIESIFLGYTHDGRVGGRLMGARGLHQRLRHREHGEEAGREAGDLGRAAGASRRGARVLHQPRAQLREHVRSADRLLPGPRGGREVQVLAGRVQPARVGSRARLHRDRTAGTSPSTPRRTARGWPTCTAGATASPPSSTSSSRPRRRPSSPAPTAGSSTRWSRRGTCGWGSGASATRSPTTSRTCTTTPGSPPRRRRRCARCCGGCTSARRSARATRVTRTTARRPRGTCSARWASTRCRSAARTTRSGRRCSRRRRSTRTTGTTSSSTPRTTARATSTSRV